MMGDSLCVIMGMMLWWVEICLVVMLIICVCWWIFCGLVLSLWWWGVISCWFGGMIFIGVCLSCQILVLYFKM